MNNFKKGDIAICISNNDASSLEKGKRYTVREVDGDFIFLNELEYGYFSFLFKKPVEIKQIKKIDTINPRVDTNLEKINEIIDVINQLSKIIKDL